MPICKRVADELIYSVLENPLPQERHIGLEDEEDDDDEDDASSVLVFGHNVF